jgi:hypothetical protein
MTGLPVTDEQWKQIRMQLRTQMTPGGRSFTGGSPQML